MKRLSRIWKFYIVSTALFVGLTTVVGFVLQMELRNKLKADLEEQVFTLARVLAKVLPDSTDNSVMMPWCREYQEAARVRITVMEKSGKVIGDSSEESIVGENRQNRPEINEAMTRGAATAVRYSETLGGDLFYAALFDKEKGKIIRLAWPMAEAKAIENEVMIFLTLILYVIPFLAIVISFFFARYVASEGLRSNG
jgi:two-component system, OmpR family, phosphate regulon sensor histidine kinase PhoR